MHLNRCKTNVGILKGHGLIDILTNDHLYTEKRVFTNFVKGFTDDN